MTTAKAPEQDRPAGQQEPAGSAKPASEPDLDLRELFLVVWRGKWFIALVTLAAVLYGVSYVRSFTPAYKATIIVRPNTDQTGQGQGLGAPNNSIIASIVGINNSSKSLIDQFKVVYKSPVVAERLIDKYDMLRVVYASQWSDERKEWIRPSHWKFELRETIKGWLGLSLWEPPTRDMLVEYITNEVVVDPLPGTEMVEIFYEHGDRDFAHWFLSTVFQEADAVLREGELERTKAKLDYLGERVRGTTVLDYRSTLLNLLSNEEKRMMILQSGLPYALEVVTPLSVPEKPARPSLARVGVAAVAGGVAVGIVLVLVFAFFRLILREPATERGGRA